MPVLSSLALTGALIMGASGTNDCSTIGLGLLAGLLGKTVDCQRRPQEQPMSFETPAPNQNRATGQSSKAPINELPARRPESSNQF